MALQAGTRLGPYEVVSLIGVGGMGEVWLASELRLGRKVPLTLLPLLLVDYGANGRPVGVEITAPPTVPLELRNQLLADLGEAPLAEQEYKPLPAA